MSWWESWRAASCAPVTGAVDQAQNEGLTFAELDEEHRGKLRQVLSFGVSDSEVESALGVLRDDQVYSYTTQSELLARSVLGHALAHRLTGAVRCGDAAATERLVRTGNDYNYGGTATVLRAMDAETLRQLKAQVGESTRRLIESSLAER